MMQWNPLGTLGTWNPLGYDVSHLNTSVLAESLLVTLKSKRGSVRFLLRDMVTWIPLYSSMLYVSY